MQKKTENVSLSITALSPLHIGCDQDYLPTEYVDHDGRLYLFSVEQLIEQLTEQPKRELLLATKDLNPLEAVKRVLSKYKKEISQTPNIKILENLRENKLANIKFIERTAYDPLCNVPVVPGSSIKGAIRTAWINKNRNLIKVGIKEDPFKLLQVSDAQIQVNNSALMFLQRPHKKPNAKPGSKSSVNYDFLLETLQKRSKFKAQLSLQSFESAGVVHPINNLKELITSINQFYFPELEKTINYLKDMEEYEYGKNWINYIQKNIFQKEGLDANKNLVPTMGAYIEKGDAFLMRLGRHGGAESLTLNGLRQINTRKYGTKDQSLTMTLSNNNPSKPHEVEPFGWVYVRVLPLQNE